jgi:hypothetical protein
MSGGARACFGVDGQSPFVSLSSGGTVLRVERGERGDDPLALFDRALKKARVALASLEGIVVDRGPDGFSSVRRRAAAAASLAAALDLPLAAAEGLTPETAAALPADAFRRGAAVAPSYERAPNITSARRVSPLKRSRP